MSEEDKKGTVGQTSDPIDHPHTQEEVVPSTTPLTIPYFEVFRTNELEYIPYRSPYLSSSSSNSGDSSSDSDSQTEEEQQREQTLTDDIEKIVNKYYPASKNPQYWVDELKGAKLDWTSVAKVVNKMGGNKDKQNTVIEQVLRVKETYAKTTRQNLKTAKGMAKVVGGLANTKKGQIILNSMKNSKVWTGTGYVDDVATQKLGKTIETISKLDK